MADTKVMNTNLGKAYFNDFTAHNWGDSHNSQFYHTPDTYPSLLAEANSKFIKLEEFPRGKKEKKMAKKQRGLYQVILVNPKECKIIFNGFVICDKAEDVLLEVDAGSKIKEHKLKVSEVDKIINFLGGIRKTKTNKDGVVELVEDDNQ